MKHISELSGIGTGIDCLIIGGGHSVNHFDFAALPDDMYIISCNNHLIELANMVIFYDRKMQEYYTVHKPGVDCLIGFKNNTIDYTVKHCTHYYNFKDIIFGDTGFHALQFADWVFNFSNIYLIGYDYDVKGKSYHHNEVESDHILYDNFKKWSVGKVLKRYEKYSKEGKTIKVDWINKIYNCNASSKLELFPFALPY